MFVLLAESKTMRPEQEPVTSAEFNANKPVLEFQADATMNYLASLSPSEISSQLGISLPLSVKAHSLAYDFPNKTTGYKSLYAFTGEAYRSFKATTLSIDSKERCDSILRIISSAYGLLRPENIIKPYRLEFNKNCAPCASNLAKTLKPKVTIEFVKEIKENKIKDIINLLPVDAELCLDWKIIRAFAKMHKICFKAIMPDGSFKTPMSKRLKELRGLMARQIIEEGIDSFEQLTMTESDYFIYSAADSKPGLPVFIVAPD